MNDGIRSSPDTGMVKFMRMNSVASYTIVFNIQY
jgi:hypothetical protein